MPILSPDDRLNVSSTLALFTRTLSTFSIGAAGELEDEGNGTGSSTSFVVGEAISGLAGVGGVLNHEATMDLVDLSGARNEKDSMVELALTIPDVCKRSSFQLISS